MGDRGHALFIILLALPFLLPLPLPGLSTPSGILIFFLGGALVLNREPWLPQRVRHTPIPKRLLSYIERKINPKLARLEKVFKPRWFDFSHGNWVVRAHGVLISASAILLALPAPPGGNVGPAAAVLLFALAVLECDGLMTLLGVVALGLALTYFGGLAVLMSHWLSNHY